MEIKEYKCPNCAGAVKFDSSSQNMKCPYCDAEFEIADLEDYQKELALSAEDRFDWNNELERIQGSGAEVYDPEKDCLSTGSCPSCGAELIGDKNTIAMVCPCCGNSQIVQKRISGMLKPEYIIPFKLEKKDAINALKNFYKGKRLLPDCFKDENRVNCIQGVYVPFWLFDAQTKAHIRFKATKTKTWSTANHIYTKTSFYNVVRDGVLGFEKVPVDGSEKMDNDYMDAIEPFDYNLKKDFQSAFLSGYLAEKYDVDAKQCMERAAIRMKASVEKEFRNSVTGYSSVSMESSTVDIKGGKISYCLFPVWVLNTKYKNENYLFTMNGESGRLVGRLPADTAKSWKYRFIFTGIFGAIFTIIIQLLRFFN
ncbi:MAG: hypothetical protein FWD47_15185 [Treponema sp.]|nr:hypothetical protein [Treponema sp.]